MYDFRRGVSNRPARGAFISRSGSGDCFGEVHGEACGGLRAEGRVGPRGVVVVQGQWRTGHSPKARLVVTMIEVRS
jgi:hypothetical protein